MKTNVISYLCSMSDRVSKNAEIAAKENFKKEIRGITIHSSCEQLKIDLDDYPELKPVAEKLLDVLVKSEESKQNEIKVAIVKEL